MASWLNTALYTVQLVLSSWYLIKHKPLRIFKWGIWVSLIVDAITSIVLFASTWMVSMTSGSYVPDTHCVLGITPTHRSVTFFDLEQVPNAQQRLRHQWTYRCGWEHHGRFLPSSF